MGDLSLDTRLTELEREEDRARFGADLSPDWEIWGPNGGYLASVALRAAGVVAERARPATINAHIVGAGTSGPVECSVRVNRRTRVATSVTVELRQGDRDWMVATVWGVDDDLTGLEHQTADRPDPPGPDGLPTFDERMAGVDLGARHPFWSNVEQRPARWIDDAHERTDLEAHKEVWYRFVPTGTFDDPWVDAMRSLILIDLDSWPAAVSPHMGDDLEHYAPTIEVTARFCADTRAEPWLLSRARTPRQTGGLIAATGDIWTPAGELVAVGGSTLLCRPVGRRPDR